MTNFWKMFGIWVGGICGAGLVLLILFRMMFVNYVDNYQLGYKFDARTGYITVLPHQGYVVTPPFVVSVHTIDLRPMQVCISAIQRVLNCKLVQFDQEGLDLFLSWHGRANYPMVSLQDILKNYAYDGGGRAYPFLKVLKELKPEEGSSI